MPYIAVRISKEVSATQVWQLATGNRQQATGNRQQATGNRQQATGNRNHRDYDQHLAQTTVFGGDFH